MLVHGLYLSGFVFAAMRVWIEREGFRTSTLSYPSMRAGLAQNAARLANHLRALSARRIHLLGHSLGGAVILTMLSLLPDPRIARVVLLGSPLTGCHVAQRMRNSGALRWLLGKSVPEWLDRTGRTTEPSREIGVIAGSVSLGLGRLVTSIPGENDGVVRVAETRLPGIADHLVLRVSHSGIIFSTAVARQVCAFLRSGRFDRG